MVLAHKLNEGERTQDVQILANVTFDSMLLNRNTLEGLKNAGFYRPSPIQLHGIPLGKCGFDLFLEAKSGTGKTMVFTVIALEKLDIKMGLQTIILAPTREIAAQICDVIKQVGAGYSGLNVEVVMGGLPLAEDIEKFKKNVHIVVGSPGRMRYLIQDKHIDVSGVRQLVLDESDKLMEKSFLVDINYIFSALPTRKQIIMSSATYPKEFDSIMKTYVQKVQHICPDTVGVLLGIKQLVTEVECNSNIVRQTNNKFAELLRILGTRDFKQCLIFCNYQARVSELCKLLTRDKWPAEQLHGQLEQTVRLDALKTLQEYKCRILVSTDLAARGIDASNVDLVINFEPPYDWQTYLHRIGRAGRFGSYGIAITILSEGKEKSKFNDMILNIHSSLNLNYLWCDKQYELKRSGSYDNLLENKIEKQNNVELPALQNLKAKEIGKGCVGDKPQEGEPIMNAKKDIAGNSISQSKRNISAVDNFVGLLSRFEIPCTCEFESFDDLVTSFDNHNINNTNKVILHDNTFMEYFDSMLNELEIVPYILDEENNYGDQIDKISEEKPCHISMNKENTYLKPHGLEKLEKKEREPYLTTGPSSSQKALEDAGLPTAFGSTKHSKKAKASKSLKDKINSPEMQKSNNRFKVSTENKRDRESSDDHTNLNNNWHNTQALLLSRSTHPCSHQYMPTKEQKQPNTSRSSCQMGFDEDEQIEADSTMEYEAWYNMFKTHIKQIEMSLYIDECSKM